MKAATSEAFALLDSLEYRKTWDMSGPCIVVREEWLEDGEVVRAKAHNYYEDTAPPAEPPAAEEQTLTAADVGDVTVALSGVAGEGAISSVG